MLCAAIKQRNTYYVCCGSVCSVKRRVVYCVTACGFLCEQSCPPVALSAALYILCHGIIEIN